MAGTTGKQRRDQTDLSLRGERDDADRTRASERDSADRAADAVVGLARETADAVLIEERDRADRQLDQSGPEARDAVAKHRSVADDVVRRERTAADAIVFAERANRARSLAALVSQERDDTDRYLLIERARFDDSLSNRDDFLGIVSHDLRNLLGGIASSAELLEGDAPDTEEGRQVLAGAKRIQRYVDRMSRLIGDLVDVASIEDGKLAVSLAQADAVTLVSEVLDTFRVAAARQKIALESEIVESPLHAVFDYQRMLQVLANLIANALKFTPSGGVVCLRAERIGDDIRLCVIDTGQGIPGDMLESVFERFWQVGKNDRRGVGLGLYICKHLIKAHGGKIWAESKLGEGTRLYVTLPAAPTAG